MRFDKEINTSPTKLHRVINMFRANARERNIKEHLRMVVL